MKILQISTSADIGGAAIAAHRLNKGLRSLNVDSTMLVNTQRNRNRYVSAPSNTYDKIMARLGPRLEQIPGKLSTVSLDQMSPSWVPDRLLRRVENLKPDILNLHWLNDGFMRIETMPKFRQPIIWTLHDMWPFAGGEHYVGESIRYKEGYNSQNRPAGESGFDINKWIWERKRKSWSKLTNLVIATPSKWMAKCSKDSILFHELKTVILPNGVDHERFHPMDHTAARNILGLPDNKKLILFGEGSMSGDKRKGYHLLVEALNFLQTQVKPDDYELVVFGSSPEDDRFLMKIHNLGHLQDEISLALAYAAVDVFVAPSIEDNLPNTVLESLSCGTPVVAFNIGGMPDMIAHKENGYLARSFETTELANGLLWVLKDKQRWNKLSEQARSTVTQQFTMKCSASRYMRIYEDILKTNG